MSHSHKQPDLSQLTRNQTLVYQALAQSEVPMSAYALLDHLREAGFRAPPQVYRALEKLIGNGMAHRLESLNAFVACSQPDCCAGSVSAFAICQICQHVEELPEHEVRDQVEAWSRKSGFAPVRTSLEISGLCGQCHEAPTEN
jgi:Fur family zinc uptake transcriptional regulator